MNMVSEILPNGDEMPSGDSLPALQTEITAIVESRNAAIATMQEALDGLSAAYAVSNTQMGAAQGFANRAHMGSMPPAYVFGPKRFERTHTRKIDVEDSMKAFVADTDASIWSYLLERSGIRSIMDVEAIKEWETSMAEGIPEVTLENLTATFQTIMADVGLIFKRGLANAFSKLDRRFKSHDGFKIGSRIILTNVFSEFSGSWSYGDKRRETITDIERVFAKLDGVAPDPHGLLHAIEASRGAGFGCRQSEVETAYFKIRGFKNGNAHLWFTRDDLVAKANKLLAEYYGEVIPDAAPVDAQPEYFTSGSLVPAKDLQFYATPESVMHKLFRDLHIFEAARVLEPSAGTGDIVQRMQGQNARITAIEIHPGRAKQLRCFANADCEVIEGNFLTYPATACFDFVIMNPPFYGTHWMEHVRHAWDCLKDEGKLSAVLPISAELGQSSKHVSFRRWAEKHSRGWRGMFTDLPAESFAESGTRINTVILTLCK